MLNADGPRQIDFCGTIVLGLLYYVGTLVRTANSAPPNDAGDGKADQKIMTAVAQAATGRASVCSICGAGADADAPLHSQQASL